MGSLSPDIKLLCGLLLLAVILWFMFYLFKLDEKKQGAVPLTEEILKQRTLSGVSEDILRAEKSIFAGRYFGSSLEPSSLEQLATTIKNNKLKVPNACTNRYNDPAEVVIRCLVDSRPARNYGDELSSVIDKAVSSKPAKFVTELLGVESEEAEIERIKLCYEDENCLLNSVELEKLTNFEPTKPSSPPQKPIRTVQRPCGLKALDRYEAACPDYNYQDYYRLRFLVNG